MGARKRVIAVHMEAQRLAVRAHKESVHSVLGAVSARGCISTDGSSEIGKEASSCVWDAMQKAACRGTPQQAVCITRAPLLKDPQPCWPPVQRLGAPILPGAQIWQHLRPYQLSLLTRACTEHLASSRKPRRASFSSSASDPCRRWQAQAARLVRTGADSIESSSSASKRRQVSLSILGVISRSWPCGAPLLLSAYACVLRRTVVDLLTCLGLYEHVGAVVLVHPDAPVRCVAPDLDSRRRLTAAPAPTPSAHRLTLTSMVSPPSWILRS